MRKTPPIIAQEITSLDASGMKKYRIAQRYHVDRKTVWKILKHPEIYGITDLLTTPQKRDSV